MSDELTTIDVQIHRESQSGKAVLVSTDGNRKGAVWLPLSAIELTPSRRDPSRAIITLTEDFAARKGLV